MITDGARDAFCAQAARIEGGLLLTNARIEGTSRIVSARLGALQLFNAKLSFGRDSGRAALVADEAEIGGDVLLHDGLTAEGYVSFLGTKISGNLDCAEGHFSNQDGDALVASNAEIGGDVLLSEGFTAEGRVSFMGAKISGDLSCSKGHFSNQGGDALVAARAEIGGAVFLDEGFTAEGSVSFMGTKISGDLSCDEGHFSNQGGDALVAVNAEIGGDVLLREGFAAEGSVSLTGAKISGDLDSSKGHFSNQGGGALVAARAEIGGAVFLQKGFTAEGQVNFFGAKMASLSCTNAQLRNIGTRRPKTTLNLTDARIGRYARLNDLESMGRICLWGTRIGGDLDCSGLQLVAWPSTSSPREHTTAALDATNVTVEGDVVFQAGKSKRDAAVIGDLWFEHACVGGSFKWDGLDFAKELTFEFSVWKDGQLAEESEKTRWGYTGELKEEETAPDGSISQKTWLVLAHASIGAALQAHKLMAELPLKIDLSATSVYTLDDEKNANDKTLKFPAGWGGSQSKNSRHVEIDLDGFTYKRIENFPKVRRLNWRSVRFWPQKASDTAEPTSPSATRGAKIDIVKQRKVWLNFQDETKFFPQPHRHLAAVMRAQGHVEEARQIAIAEGDAAPGGWANLKRRTFGACFGYGLDPMRATCSLILTLGLGWVLVGTAWHGFWPIRDSVWTRPNPVLVLSPNEVEALGAIHGSPLNAKDKIPDKDAIRCGRKEIIPPLYALDMMVPVVPLHQEDRCEISLNAGWLWPFLWAVFSIIGKIITTLAIITYSGVLKPKDE